MVKSDINRHSLRLLATFFSENGHPFFGRRIIEKKSAPKSYDQKKKGLDFEDLLPKNLETFDEN